MAQPDARRLIEGLQGTLRDLQKPYEEWITDFGQVTASERRAAGHNFTLNAHVRGLVLSQLSNQRPWYPIAKNLDRIDKIFLNYNAEALQAADSDKLRAQLCGLHCGNRAIAKQLSALRDNIEVLVRIESEFSSLDVFVTSKHPFKIAEALSDPRSPHKLKQLGFTLALEYLRNVGIRAAKPDLHVCRILGGERLGYFPAEPREADAAQKVADLAAEAGVNATYLDNLLWIYCAQQYGEVCTARPRCGICKLADCCNYPTLRLAGHPVEPTGTPTFRASY